MEDGSVDRVNRQHRTDDVRTIAYPPASKTEIKNKIKQQTDDGQRMKTNHNNDNLQPTR